MSDLCMIELEDNVWDEFSASDDHIVPHPVDKNVDSFVDQVDRHKKSQIEAIRAANNVDDALKCSSQKEKETGILNLIKEDTMLDKDSWSETPDGVFPVSCDCGSVKEFSAMASEETSMSGHCLGNGNVDSIGRELCADDPILGKKCPAVDNNLYGYSLSCISQTDDDLSFFDNDHGDSFFDNDHGDKESSDPLYYGWPDDLGNFEDVDRMFRSCDSTFGLGSLSNDDDLCWFSSSHSAEGSEDALKLGSKFSNSEASAWSSVSEHHEGSQIRSTSPSNYDPIKKSIFMDDKINLGSTVDHSALGHSTFLNGSDSKPVSNDYLLSNEQINSNKKQARHHNQSEARRKERNPEKGSFPHSSNAKRGDSSHQVFSRPDIHQRKRNTGSNSLNYMRTHIPYMQIDYCHSSDQISVCPTQSSVKSENNGHPSPSPKESSYASNHAQSIESSLSPTHKAPAITTDENRENMHSCLDLQPSSARSFKPTNIESPFYGPVPVQKQVHQSEYDMESNSAIEGVSIGIPAELDSSNVQESSCRSSVLDEISLEATSFRQLQQVTEQLDIRTKLCIRDSLYRLARSAEQRHNCGNASGGKREEGDTSGAPMAEEENKSTGFIDMETDTNPIDRSIAHLLFHRPSDPSIMPANDALHLKSHATIHGSISSSPMITKERVYWEETGTVVDKSKLMTDGKQ